MEFNINILMYIILLNLIVISLTIFYAHKKQEPIVGNGLLSSVLNFLFPPFGWYFLYKKIRK